MPSSDNCHCKNSPLMLIDELNAIKMSKQKLFHPVKQLMVLQEPHSGCFVLQLQPIILTKAQMFTLQTHCVLSQ